MPVSTGSVPVGWRGQDADGGAREEERRRPSSWRAAHSITSSALACNVSGTVRPKCPPSALMRQKGRIEEGMVSGSS
jgi:hypothetical protein